MQLLRLFKTSLPLGSKTRTPVSLGDRDPQWREAGCSVSALRDIIDIDHILARVFLPEYT
jgi:hypothetical protein